MKKLLAFVCVLLSFQSKGQTTYLSEDFSSGVLPSGWTSYNSFSPCVGWEFGDSLQSSGFNVPPNGMYAAVNDDKYDNAAGTANLTNFSYLITPIINTTGADSLRLEFDYFSSPSMYGHAKVEISNDGVNFNYSYGLNEYTTWTHFTWDIPLNFYTTNFRIRFSYGDDNARATGLAIDNVRLSDPPSFDLALMRCFQSNILPAQNAKTGCRVHNNGLTAITSFNLNVFVDGTLNFTQAYTNLNLRYRATFDCIPAQTLGTLSPGAHVIRMTISDVNGLPFDQDAMNDASAYTTKVVSVLPERHPVVIDKTGSWCSFCSDGSLRLDSTTINFPGSIPVSMHGGDMMDSLSSSAWSVSQFYEALLPGGFPKMTSDAYKFPDLTEIPVSPQEYNPLVAERMVMYEPVSVEIKNVSWNSFTRTVTATVQTTVYDTITEDLRLNLWILADELYGLGTGWDQVNAANIWPGHPYYGLGDPIVGFHHHHVLLSMRGGAWGSDGVIPNTAYPGSVYQHTYSMQVPYTFWGSTAQTNTIDSSNITLVGLVQKYDPNIFDRRILNAQSGKVTDFLTSIDPLNEDLDISIYPSPAASFLKISSSRETIQNLSLFTMEGKLILEQRPETREATMMVGDFPEGMYLLRIRSNRGQEAFRKITLGR